MNKLAASGDAKRLNIPRQAMGPSTHLNDYVLGTDESLGETGAAGTGGVALGPASGVGAGGTEDELETVPASITVDPQLAQPEATGAETIMPLSWEPKPCRHIRSSIQPELHRSRLELVLEHSRSEPELEHSKSEPEPVRSRRELALEHSRSELELEHSRSELELVRSRRELELVHSRREPHRSHPCGRADERASHRERDRHRPELVRSKPERELVHSKQGRGPHTSCRASGAWQQTATTTITTTMMTAKRPPPPQPAWTSTAKPRLAITSGQPASSTYYNS